MLHQDIKLKYPRIQTLSLKIAVSGKCQSSLVIQVCKNVSCFSCYCSIVQYYIERGEVIIRLFPTGLVTVYARTVEVYY